MDPTSTRPFGKILVRNWNLLFMTMANSLCAVHCAFNGFHSIQEYNNEAEKYAIALHGWFRLAPCKREDFQNVGEEHSESSTIFIRHLNMHWLTFVPALEKVEESWKTTKKYFSSWWEKPHYYSKQWQIQSNI